jgi:ribosomal protein L37AE/L43A
MVDYKIVKYCRLCKKRFVVNKGESKIIYCDDCKLKIENQDMEEEK